MAVFSHRVIQGWLEENLPTIGREATLGQIGRLNDKKSPSNVIAAVWEVAIIRALRHLGKVEHETKIGEGPKRPDVLFQSSGSDLKFLADIVTVSDAGLHDQNRVTEFRMGLHRLMRKQGIGHLGVQTEVGRITEGSYGDSVVRAAVPSKQNLDRFLAHHFLHFVRQIAANPEAARTHSVQEEGIEVRASYDPEHARFSSGSSPSYTTAYSLTDNPIFKRLEEKRKQLKGSGFDGIRGVILCDGGCELLHRTGYSGPEAYSLDQVIREFLSGTDSIHFVLALEHQVRHSIQSTTHWSHELIPRLFLGKALEGRGAELGFLLQIPQLLPPPIETPSNAFPKRIHGGKLEPQPSQEYRVSGNKVAIDAGDLIGLLSGVIKQDDWLHERMFNPKPVPFDQIPKQLSRAAHVFKAMHQEGRGLIAIRVLKRENSDHDLIEFEFGDIDPALGDFQMPSNGAQPG